MGNCHSTMSNNIHKLEEKSEIQIFRENLEKNPENGKLNNSLGKALFILVLLTLIKRKILKKLSIIYARL